MARPDTNGKAGRPPRVSVLVPVYRTDPRVLRETIAAVLAQTFADFELLVVDDCPSDSREGVVREFRDARILYAQNERNMGITPTRNRLLEMARGEYLAVLDHDDICRGDRLEKEVAYLDSHPECGVVSSFTRLFPSGQLVARPLTDRAVRIALMTHCAVAHSAAMIRAAVLAENGVRYEEDYSPCEDYRLFFRLVEFTRFACIPEPLLDYRVHESNTTGAQYDRMIATATRIRDEARAGHPELWAAMERGEGRSPRVVVSGGWSYGNLGDDAILEATARLLWRHLPEAEVTWQAYDEDFARESGVVPIDRVAPSMHRFADRGFSFWTLQTAGRSPGYMTWPALVRWAYGKFLRRASMRRSKRRDRTADPSPSFKGADLYIMSGGGYFNLWPSKFDACIRELELAHENGCKVMLAGQSVGPFTDEQKSRLKAALRPTDVIYVRDAESAAEIEALGFEAMLAPDLALGFPCEAATDGRLVTVVPGWLSEGQDILLAGQLAEFLKGRGRGFRLRIVQTCRLWPDVLSARNLGRRLRELGVPFETALPNNYGELRAAVEGSALVASRRMHAMVIGWRSGSRVFALTKSRKIDGFLDMIGAPGNICSEDAWSGLSEGLSAAMQGERPSVGARAAVAENIDRAFRECLERSGVACGRGEGE